jgi:probable F420-dependent oxidoreductase
VRFSVQLPTDRVDAADEFLSGAAVGEMAACAESAGFDACFVTDHPMPADDWLASGGHHALDPFVALSFAAASTRSLRLQTHVLIAGYRNPFLAAKALATLDVLSGGRVIAGIAAGYLEGEFAALGADASERNELADEAILAMKRVWSESGVELQGRHFHAAGNTALPRPQQQPHPPLWVGGNSQRAIRRAVELGDGWLPFPAPARMAVAIGTAPLETVADLEKRLAYLRAHAERIGRSEPLDVCFVPFGLAMFSRGEVDPDALLAELDELARMGVTWAAVSPRSTTRAEYTEQLQRFGETVIQPLRGSG